MTERTSPKRAEKKDAHKESIRKFRNLIKAIPIEKQAARVKKDVWESRFCKYTKVFAFLFSNCETDIVISRKDILDEPDCRKRVVMILAWGYPTGGRGHYIENILSNLLSPQKEVDLCKVLKDKQGRALSQDDFDSLIAELEKVDGLGESTWSKLLYFFDIKVKIPKHGFKRCQIFDTKIKDSLNNPQFCELEDFNEERGISTWKQDNKGKTKENYFQYMNLLAALSDEIRFNEDDKFKLEKLENFLFHYNLDFRF